MADDVPLVRVFVPPLLTCLIRGERVKGSPLTRDEVLAIRDSASSMLLSLPVAQDVEEKRGHPDIDSAYVWEHWIEYRAQRAADRKGD